MRGNLLSVCRLTLTARAAFILMRFVHFDHTLSLLSFSISSEINAFKLQITLARHSLKEAHMQNLCMVFRS